MPPSRAAGLAHAEGVGRGSRTTCLRRTWPVSSWAHLWATQPQAPWRHGTTWSPEPLTPPVPSPALPCPLPCPALTQGEYLPEQHPKGPHIALRGIHLVKDALRCHPLQGKPGLREKEETCPHRERKRGGGHTLGSHPPIPRLPRTLGPKKGFLATCTHVSTQVAPAVCPAGTCHLPEGFLFPAAVPGPCKPSSSPPHLLTWFSQWKPGVTPDPSPCSS